jgi:hypothetical protein
MREPPDRIETEETRQCLERMRGTEEPIHEIGIGLSPPDALIVQVREILAHVLEDLFRLGDELPIRLATASRLGALPGHRGLPFALGTGFARRRPAARPVEQILCDLP